MRRKRKTNRPLKTKILFLLILFIAVISSFLSLRLLNVQEVEVVNSLNCIQITDLPQIEKLRGQNFFITDKKNIEESIKKAHPCIKGISIKKIFPNKLQVQLQKREAKIKVVNINSVATESAEIINTFVSEASSGAKMSLNSLESKDVLLADEEGVIFADDTRTNLPEVYFQRKQLADLPDNLKSGDKLEDNLIAGILEVINKLKTFGLNMEGSILNPSGTYFVNSLPKIYFDLKDNLDLQLASLQLILKEAKIDSEQSRLSRDQLEFIDLRFDKPIVRITPNGKR